MLSDRVRPPLYYRVMPARPYILKYHAWVGTYLAVPARFYTSTVTWAPILYMIDMCQNGHYCFQRTHARTHSLSHLLRLPSLTSQPPTFGSNSNRSTLTAFRFTYRPSLTLVASFSGTESDFPISSLSSLKLPTYFRLLLSIRL